MTTTLKLLTLLLPTPVCLPGEELLERRPLLRIHEVPADLAGLLLFDGRTTGVPDA